MAGIVAVALLVGYALPVAAPSPPSLDTITRLTGRGIPRANPIPRITWPIGANSARNGAMSRAVITEIPDAVMKKAVCWPIEGRPVLREHGGVDFAGSATRGARQPARRPPQGAGSNDSTVQVARNLFLSGMP
ncbi:hypothetical protein ACU4GD_43480 [Cupriavidus basilensis]